MKKTEMKSVSPKQLFKNIMKKVIYLLSFALIMLVIVVITAWIIYFLYSPKNESDVSTENVSANWYKYLQFDPTSNDISRGRLSNFEKLSYNEISHEDRNNNLVLISKFGSYEYHCEGKCFCEEYERRNVVSGIIQRPIMFFVAAVTSVVATKIAKDHVEKKCLEEYNNDCPNDKIRSEIGTCYTLHEDDPEIQGIEESDEKAEEEKDNPLRKIKYMCKGYCVIAEIVDTFYDFLFVYHEDKLSSRGTKNTKRLEHMEEFGFDQCVMLNYEKEVSILVKKVYSDHQNDHIVRTKFMNGEFKTFCKQESAIKEDHIDSIFEEDYKEHIESKLNGEDPFWCSSRSPYTPLYNIECELLSVYEKGNPYLVEEDIHKII